MTRRSILLLLPTIVAALTQPGCETTGGRSSAAERAALAAAIAAEAPGDYWIGRRYYKRDYKFWGYVRRPQQPWSTAQMVMLNEQKTLAPDRAQNTIGSDNNYEYRLFGTFGEQVYEPASNSFYPEFLLDRAELVSVSPPAIFREPGATDPARRIIAKPR